MQLAIERNTLAEGLAKIVPVLPGKTEIEILRHIVFSTGAKSVSCRATDTDVEMSVTMAAEVETRGVCTIPGRTLFELVRKFPKDGTVVITAENQDIGGGEVHIVCGRSRFKLPALSADDLPTLDAGAGGALFEMPSSQLRAAFEATEFAICTDETRYYLQGVYLHAKGEELIAVATDGHRMSRKKMPLPPQANGMPSVIVPRETIRMALKFLPENEADIELCVTSTRITIRAGETQIISKLIDGSYPDYERVIPGAHLGCAIVSREALMRAAARVATILDDRGHALALGFAGSTVTVSATGGISGSSGTEEISDATFDAEAVTIGLNGAYLGDVLGAMSGGQLAVRTGSAGDPVLFEEVDGDGSHIVVLMPMRL